MRKFKDVCGVLQYSRSVIKAKTEERDQRERERERGRERRKRERERVLNNDVVSVEKKSCMYQKISLK